MKDVILKGLKVFVISLTVCVICFFVVVSFNALKVGLFSKDIGYDIYGRTSSEAEPEFLYSHYFKDGDDTKAKGYEDQGYELLKYTIRSDVEKGADITLTVLSQIVCLVILTAFVYNELWKIGNKDFESLRLYGTKINKLKGLFIGMVAVAPSFLFLTFCLLTKTTVMAKLPIALFTFTNCYVYDIVFRVTNGAMYWADVNLIQAVVYYAVLIILPLIACASYIVGFKDISLEERLIYKKTDKIKRRV